MEQSDLDEVFVRLARSKFRSRFKSGDKELRYLEAKGLEAIGGHGRDFVEKRLTEATPANDGKQTPMRGHPVFIAQHATATCCRKCLAKWHGIKKGTKLSPSQIDYIVSVIMAWLQRAADSSN